MTARVLPLVLLAAGLFAAGCGSQQGSPLSVAKTKRAFASAGIPLGRDRFTLVTLQSRGKRVDATPPVAELAPVSNGDPSLVTVTVFPTTADGLRAARLQARVKPNPRVLRHVHLHITRVENVVILAVQRVGRPPVSASERQLDI
jgi:hypothetical protein